MSTVKFWDMDRDRTAPFEAIVTEQRPDGTVHLAVFNRESDKEWAGVNQDPTTGIFRREVAVTVAKKFTYGDPTKVKWPGGGRFCVIPPSEEPK